MSELDRKSQTCYQRVLRKTYDRKIPFNCHMELTYRCNLSCIHCYASGNRHADEMNTSEIIGALDQLAELGCLFLTLTGGDMLCRPDAAEIIGACSDRGFAIRLFTNGTLLTPELADTIAESEPLSVEMSLYGVDPDIHDAVTRTPKSHERTLNAIRLCRARNLNVTVKTLLMKQNVAQYGRLSEFAEQSGAGFVFDFVLAPADDGSRPMDKYGLSENEIADFIFRHAGPPPDPPAVPAPSDPICGAGSNTVCIAPDGAVFPCLAARIPAGNIRQATFSDIWRHSSILDKFRNAGYCNLKECAGCEYAGYCSHCPGIAYAECGNFTGKYDSACAVARATKRAMEMLRERNR